MFLVNNFTQSLLTLFLTDNMDFDKYTTEFSLVAKEKGYTPDEISALLDYARKLNEKELPIIFDQFHLSLLLGYDYYYLLSVSNAQYCHYKKYEIPKKNGDKRTIMEPYPALKDVQTWILKNILEPAAKQCVSPVAKAFIPGKTLRENARFHKNKKTVVALDLHDFFGTVRFYPVYNLFQKLGYNKAVSIMLTHLCMLHGSLPQGAPTSPMLSNMVFFELDKRIFNYCRKRNILYTRYADDLTFSSDKMDQSHLISYVKMLVTQSRFTLNEEKTKVMGRGTRQSVTGVVVNDKMQVSRVYRDKVRQEVYYSIKYGFCNHMAHIDLPEWIKTPEVYARHLYGKVNFVLQINPKDTEFVRYAEWLKEYAYPKQK